MFVAVMVKVTVSPRPYSSATPSLVGSPIGLDAKIVDWVERGVPPGALSFKWNHEPKVLVVTPHPNPTVSCEDAPAGERKEQP